MARKKKGAPPPRRGNGARGGRGTFRGSQHSSLARSTYYADSSDANSVPHLGFTLADEARHTSQHDHSSWGQVNNLRQRPVKFVSAGFSEPLKQLEGFEGKDEDESPPSSPASPIPTLSTLRVQDASPILVPEDANADQQAEAASSAHMSSSTEQQPIHQPVSDESSDDGQFIGPEELETSLQSQAPPNPGTDLFFFDVTGSPSAQQTAPAPVCIPDRPSSRGSTSSEEIILFRGRDIRTNPPRATKMDMIHLQTEINVLEKQIAAPSSEATTQKPKKSTDKKRRRRRRNIGSSSDEDAILADYIANMKEDTSSDEAPDGRLHGHNGSSSEKPNHLSNKDVSDASDTSDGEASEADAGEVSESELDDERLARAFSGHDLGGTGGDVDFGDSSSDDSDDEKAKQPHPVDDLDMMDWERPSLRRKRGKGAKAKIEFNVSDSELEQTLQAAWSNDRMKKSERKKQREQLRALGMLGKKANPDDLRVKYPDGIKMEEVAAEIELFLIDEAESLTLPPMDNHARKMVHDFANKFKIKSKSTGKGDQRRPTLYRTLRTLPYNESAFQLAVGRINRRYFPRLDTKGKRARLSQPSRSNDAAVTYRDGEVVGAAAPELGVGNRGRTMLEKMGWNHGTALGIDNKGILQPVTHTMKRSKAGLG